MTNAIASITGAWRSAGRILQGNIRVFAVTSVLGMFGRAMAFPYVSLYILSLGGRPEQVGLVNSLAPLLGLIAFPLGGYISDHVGRVKLIGWTTVGSGVVQLLYVIAPSWEWLAVGSLLMGLGVLQFPASSALTADSLAPQDRSKGIALMNMLSSAPAMLAPWVAGLLLDQIGVKVGARYLYGFLAAGNIISGLVAMRYLRESTVFAPHSLSLGAIPALLRDTYGGLADLLRRLPRNVLALAVVVILGFLLNAIAGPFWVVYAVDHIGLSNAQWGSILLVETVIRNAALLPAGMLGDRWGRTQCMIVSLVMVMVGMPLFIYVQGYGGAIAVRALIAVANALFIPSSIALLADGIPRDIRGRAMAALGQGGVMMGASGGGTGGPGLGYLVTVPLILSSFGAGFIYSAGPALPWVVGCGCAAAALAVTLFFVRDVHSAEV